MSWTLWGKDFFKKICSFLKYKNVMDFFFFLSFTIELICLNFLDRTYTFSKGPQIF